MQGRLRAPFAYPQHRERSATMDIVTITQRHAAASMPLHIPAVLACNTSDEQFLANMRANAAAYPKGWVKRMPAHDRKLVICGGGPSLSDHVALIKRERERGADVWALNRSAQFLSVHGFLADAQVIMDARPDTIALLCPSVPIHYLASQCDPALFAAVHEPRLWHATIGNEAPDFPQHPEDYTFIGAASTVGVTALLLAACLGYRDITCFGYDSSIEGESRHAYPQWLTDEEALICETEFGGMVYRSPPAMKAQVLAFTKFVPVLERDLGVRVTVKGRGLLPAIWNAPAMTEKQKYEAIWQMPEYRLHSPGLDAVDQFLAWCRPWAGELILDAGCGAGAATRELEARGWDVTTADLAANCMPDRKPDHLGPLADLPPWCCDWVFCCDVLEHIPPGEVKATLAALCGACREGAFLRISTRTDSMGELIGEPLHLSVHTPEWWREALREHPWQVANSSADEDSVTFYMTKE